MSDLGARLARRRWSIGSVRFMRDVFASVLATGLATVAFSHLSQEPAQPVAHPPKWSDRISNVPGDVPTRVTGLSGSAAMFATHLPEAVSWSSVPRPNVLLPKANAEAPVQRFAAANQDVQRRPALPPTRPASVAVTPAEPMLQPPPPEARGTRVFGWELPGSDLLPQLPSGRETLQRVAALGGEIARTGEALAQTIGLK